MCSHAPFEPTVTKFCVWGRVGDVITDAKFYGNRLRVLELQDPPLQTPFPILNAHRPYNSVSVTTELFSPKVRGNAVMHVFTFWISLSLPEIFALKVGRGPKSSQI